MIAELVMKVVLLEEELNVLIIFSVSWKTVFLKPEVNTVIINGLMFNVALLKDRLGAEQIIEVSST